VVDLAGVEAGFVGPFRRGRPQVDLVLDLLLGHGPAGQEVGPGELFLGKRRGALDVAHGGIARQQAGRVPGTGVLELDGDRASVFVHGFSEPLEAGDEPVVVQVQLHAFVAPILEVVDVLDAQRVLDAAGLDHEEADPAFGQTLVVGDHARSDGLVLFHERGAVGGLDDPVARLHRADHPRLHESLETLRGITHLYVSSVIDLHARQAPSGAGSRSGQCRASP